MCHPTIKTFKSLNNNQSKNKKQKLESPQQWRLPPLLRNFKVLSTNNCKQHIKRDNNLFFSNLLQLLYTKKKLVARRIAKLDVPTTTNNKYCSLYLKVKDPIL
jgi:hypothetical protein